MPEMLISALVQAPFVLVMAFLVQQFLKHLNARDEEWRDFMDRADAQFAERLNGLTEAVDRLTNTVIAHDAAVRGTLRGLRGEDGRHAGRMRKR